MTPRKMARLEESLNTTGRKYLAYVPYSPTKLNVILDRIRAAGLSTNLEVIEGVIGNCLRMGLIEEPALKTYMRVRARDFESEEPETTTPDLTLVANNTPVDPMTRFSQIATTLRQVADEIEALAVDMDESVKAAAKDGAQLRELQALLKRIAG